VTGVQWNCPIHGQKMSTIESIVLLVDLTIVEPSYTVEVHCNECQDTVRIILTEETARQLIEENTQLALATSV
jgi:hypothetical protein